MDELDRTQLLKEWLLKASIRFILCPMEERTTGTDFNESVAEEIQECLDDDAKYELIKSYFNCLMFSDNDSEWFWKTKTGEYKDTHYMLGWKNTDALFPGTVKMFPHLTKYLTICVYS
jgi:hypothetical protein